MRISGRLGAVAVAIVVLAAEGPPAPGRTAAQKALDDLGLGLLALELAPEQCVDLAPAAEEAIREALSGADREAFDRLPAPPAGEGAARERLAAAFAFLRTRTALPDHQARHLRARIVDAARRALTEAQQTAAGVTEPGKEVEPPELLLLAQTPPGALPEILRPAAVPVPPPPGSPPVAVPTPAAPDAAPAEGPAEDRAPDVKKGPAKKKAGKKKKSK